MCAREVCSSNLVNQSIKCAEFGEAFKCRTGRLTPEARAAVEQIEAAAEAKPLQLRSGEVDGQFELLLNTTNYLDDDACTTLGTLTFQQFGPSDLRVRFAEENLPCFVHFLSAVIAEESALGSEQPSGKPCLNWLPCLFIPCKPVLP